MIVNSDIFSERGFGFWFWVSGNIIYISKSVYPPLPEKCQSDKNFIIKISNKKEPPMDDTLHEKLPSIKTAKDINPLPPISPQLPPVNPDVEIPSKNL